MIDLSIGSYTATMWKMKSEEVQIPKIPRTH